jgi:hypothetical protein
METMGSVRRIGSVKEVPCRLRDARMFAKFEEPRNVFHLRPRTGSEPRKGGEDVAALDIRLNDRLYVPSLLRNSLSTFFLIPLAHSRIVLSVQ